MEKLPLHDLIINQGFVQELMDKKESDVKYIAMDEDQRIFAYFKEVKCVAQSNGKMVWGDPDNIGSYIFIAEPKDSKIDHTSSCEKIDWEYLTTTGSDEPEYNMEKLGDVYKALLDGHIIKTWQTCGISTGAAKYVMFDENKQEFLISWDVVRGIFEKTENTANSLFLDKCEIYKQPTERLWLYYSYDKERGILLSQGGQFLPIEDSPPTDFSFTWVKTEEVR